MAKQYNSFIEKEKNDKLSQEIPSVYVSCLIAMDRKEELQKFVGDTDGQYFTTYIVYSLLPDLEKEKQRGLLKEVERQDVAQQRFPSH